MGGTIGFKPRHSLLWLQMHDHVLSILQFPALSDQICSERRIKATYMALALNENSYWDIVCACQDQIHRALLLNLQEPLEVPK